MNGITTIAGMPARLGLVAAQEAAETHRRPAEPDPVQSYYEAIAVPQDVADNIALIKQCVEAGIKHLLRVRNDESSTNSITAVVAQKVSAVFGAPVNELTWAAADFGTDEGAHVVVYKTGGADGILHLKQVSARPSELPLCCQAGANLDRWGAMYGIVRSMTESDKVYRKRIHNAACNGSIRPTANRDFEQEWKMPRSINSIRLPAATISRLHQSTEAATRRLHHWGELNEHGVITLDERHRLAGESAIDFQQRFMRDIGF